MHVVVIGGTRLTGPHVVRSLREAGHRVTVFHRGHDCRDASHVHGDRANFPRDLHGDVVVDMWCMTEAHACATVEQFRDERLVVASSGDVYRNYDGFRGRYEGPPDPVPLREDSPLRETRFPYRGARHAAGTEDFFNDYDKISVEDVVRGPRTTILRFPAVYGPNDEQHRFAGWIETMDSGAPVIRIDRRQAEWRWTRGFSGNVADAVVLAALNERAAGRTYNVGEIDGPRDAEWLRMLGDAVRYRGRIERADDVPGTMPVNFAYDLFTDTTAIRSELGYHERVSRNVALAQTVAWERAATTKGGLR
ncbi:MAG TPA: NAD-dependent epimerase/dehydratase family protein [Thermoanaerobaculia bacterium]